MNVLYPAIDEAGSTEYDGRGFGGMYFPTPEWYDLSGLLCSLVDCES